MTARADEVCSACGGDLQEESPYNAAFRFCPTCRKFQTAVRRSSHTTAVARRNGSRAPDEDFDARTADIRITAAPSNPLAVARDLSRDLYHDDHDLVLRHWRGDYYRYSGGVWNEAEESGIREAIYTWLETAFYPKKDSLAPWEPTSRKVNDVADALKAVGYLNGQTEPGVWLDKNRATIPAVGTIVVSNGLLHVPTRVLVPHSPSFWAHNRLTYDYDDQAPYPSRWFSFLDELWADDQSSIDTLQEIFGYLVGGATSQQKIFLLVGPKRSGKGTIGRVLTGILGRHNVAAPTRAGMATNFGLQEDDHAPIGSHICLF
jgi:putative DNA primase/helicase